MAIFDVNHKFMAFVDSFQEFNCLAVNATYKNNLTFYFKGSDSLTTGKYNIEMYFKPFGGYWQRVLASSQSIADVGPIEVVHPNYIYLNSEIKLNRSELMQEEPVTVSLNLLNKERKTFFGQYRVCLLNLDSTLKESIDTLYETKGLLYNNSYPSPYMSFKSSEIVADSGKYLLAIQFKADSTNDWVLAGSKYFKSLFQVNVLPQPYKPDKYEVNNTYETSYSLPVIFKNDTAEVKTTGSNLHKKTDLDYYKIVLPPGYQYLINARLQDIKSCNNGEIYAANALFYTFTSSGIWSEAYDSMMTSSFEMKGGSFNFYFQITLYPLVHTCSIFI
jgi:hypothetical protein